MACRYTYKGKTYEVSEFDDLLRALPPAEAAKFMPGVKALPAAPFVGKTDAWVALAIKRVVKMAVDGGYDRVAFVTGEQSASRFSLDKAVDRLSWESTRTDGAARNVQLDLPNSNPVRLRVDGDGAVLAANGPGFARYEGKGLDEIIGKELTEKVLASPNGDLKVDGLKIEANGMRAFYDRIVPSVAKDVMRKVGGGQIQGVVIASSRMEIVERDDGFVIFDKETKTFYRGGSSGRPWVDYPANAKVYLSKKTAEKAAVELAGEQIPQPGFDITPAMREAAAGGLPLFKRAQAANDAGLSASDLQPVADALTSNGVKATVLPSRDQLPPAALAEVKTVDPTGIARGALTSDGQIWLFANRLSSHAEAFEVALHEGFHRGLRLLGDKGSKVLAQIYATNAKVRKLADAYQKDYPDLDREDATNEALADLAGKGEAEKLNYWAALKRLVRDFLRRVADAAGIKMEWTDSDVTSFVASMSRKGLTNGAHADGGAQMATGNIELSRPPRHTPAEQAALAKAGITPGRTLKQSVVQAWNKATMLLRNRSYLKLVAQQATLDQFVGIKDVVQRELGGLPVDQDPYITARLANGGSASVMHALLLHGQAKWAANKQHLEKIDGTRGLLDILAPLGDDLNDWFGWMVGNRAERLKREGRENNLTDADIQALQGLANTPEKLTKFRAAAVDYAAFKRSVLDIAQGAGLIDPAGRQVWDHADYIPFYRQIDERSTFTATGKKGLAGQSSGIRVLKGGESALNDPMENLLMNFSRLIDASLKNNALRKTIQAVDGTWLVSKVGYEMTGQLMPKAQVKKILEEAGTPADIIDVLPDEAFDGMAKIWSIQAPSDPDVVRVMVGGKPQFYKVDDPILLRSLTSFVPFDFPGLAAARLFKRVLTSAVTSTPDFLARNFIRDSLATRMISRDGVTVGSAIRGLGRSFAEKGAGEAMLFAGASFQGGQVSAGNIEGSARTVRRALRRKGIHAGAAGAAAVVIDSPARVWDVWTKARDATENANREAVYEAALRSGKGATQAAFESKDLMDFSLRGGHPLYQMAADMLPFFNARVQGLYRLARVGGPGAVGKAAVRRFATYAVMMSILSAALAAINAGRDDYNRLPDWEKDTYWHIFIGDQHFKIPKPFELGAMFGSIPERITRYLMGVDTGSKLGQRLGSILHDQLAVDLVPQMFRPALDVYANWDAFRDRPIETTSDEGKIPSQRFDARTSKTATAAVQAVAPLADRVGLSPKRLEYLIGGYLGTVGTYALGGVDIMVRAAIDAPATPAWRADDIPVVKSFYAVDPARATVYESDLYAMREEVEKVYKSIQASLKQEDEAAAEYLRQRFSKELAARDAIKDGAEDLATIRKDMNAIYADPKMTPERKRELIDKLQVERNKIAEQTMKAPEVQALR